MYGRFRHRFCPRPHDHDHPFRFRMPFVFKQVVLAACQLGEFIHRLLHNARARLVKQVYAFPCLEVDIRVLGCAAHHRCIWRQTARPVCPNEVIIHHGPQHSIIQRLNLVHFVGSAEAIKEVQKRHARFQRRRRSDEGKVVDFLHIVGR